jgi:hypothetical protein
MGDVAGTKLRLFRPNFRHFGTRYVPPRGAPTCTYGMAAESPSHERNVPSRAPSPWLNLSRSNPALIWPSNLNTRQVIENENQERYL